MKKTLSQVEQEQGKPLDVLIPTLLLEMGTQEAVADYLGISQPSVSSWLKKNGYVSKTIYVKEEESDANYAPANAG